jgi:7-cyano-7-deazaguanine reductase
MSQIALSLLGKKTIYSDIYNPTLLHPIDRIAQNCEISMLGYDLWHLYELGWLNSNGMPQVAFGNILYMSVSRQIIESKSLKLYLNSFNNSKFVSKDSVAETISNDLSKVLDTDVWVKIFDLNSYSQIINPSGISIDNQELVVESFVKNSKNFLSKAITSNKIISEKLYSNLLRSNCPVTNQPDWGTITIEYRGYQLSHEQLLRYILSYRECNDFHETCVENIYCDLMHFCNPLQLRVYANYTRRGGIDINPYRSNRFDFDIEDVLSSSNRFIRQ